MCFLNNIGNAVFAGAYNSYLNHFFKRGKRKKKKDVKRIVCQEIVGSVCRGARKGRAASSFCLWWVSYCPEGALAPGAASAVLCGSLSAWPGLLWPRVDQTSRGESSPHLHHF